jgi:Uma2 family endonuclease
VERNVGEKPHSKLVQAFGTKYPGLHVWPERRMKSVNNRHRIPDVSVTLTEPETDVLEQAPFIAIEILSSNDTASDLLEKLAEYAAIETPNIWIFDPRRQRMYTYHTGTLQEVATDTIATTVEPEPKSSGIKSYSERGCSFAAGQSPALSEGPPS